MLKKRKKKKETAPHTIQRLHLLWPHGMPHALFPRLTTSPLIKRSVNTALGEPQCTPPHPSQFVFFPPVPSYVWQSEPLTRHSDSTEMRLVHGSLHRTPPIPSATIRPRRPPHHRWKLINVSGLLWVLYSGTAAV